MGDSRRCLPSSILTERTSGGPEDEVAGGGMPILVMVDDVSDMTFASVVPKEGVAA